MDEDVVDSGEHNTPPPPPRYTLKQAFYKAYSTTPPKHENDMLLAEIPREDRTRLVDYYEYANNPSPHWDRYYTQYHAFEVIVFKKHAAETWDAIVDFFKDNHQLSKRYSKNLSYMLQKQRQCQNSYSTVILMVVAYPRHRQKNKEIAEQFIIDSGLKSNFPIWGVSACKSYAYLSPEEYIKLLNTHAEGCFVSHSYPRFRAFTDEWESRMTRRRHDDDDEEDGDDDSNSSFTSDDDDDGCDGGDDSSTTTTSDDDMSCCSSSSDDAADAVVDMKDGGQQPPPNTTRRFFSPPHPSLAAVSSCTNVPTKAVNSAKLSSPGGSNDDDAGGTSPVVVADKRHGKKNVRFQTNSPPPQKKMLNRFYRATGFMSHANCGLHKLTVVAKDIHKQTNTLIFHKRSFDRRHEKDIVRSKDYLLPHHSGGAPRNNTNNNRKRKLVEAAAIATPVIVAHQQQQQQSKKNRKNK